MTLQHVQLMVEAEEFRDTHIKLVELLKDDDLDDEERQEFERKKELVEMAFETTALCFFNPKLMVHVGLKTKELSTAMKMLETSEQIEASNKWVKAWCEANPHYNMIPPELVLQNTGKKDA